MPHKVLHTVHLFVRSSVICLTIYSVSQKKSPLGDLTFFSQTVENL